MDLLAANYHDLSYIMDLDFEIGLKLILKARERQEEGRQWLLYCSAYPHFTKDNFMTFKQFYDKDKLKVSKKSKEQIFDEVKALRKRKGWD